MIPKQKRLGEDVMFILNGKLFEKCIQKTDSVAVETCDKTEFPFHIRQYYWLSVTLVLPGSHDKCPLYVLKSVEKYDWSSTCEFEDVFSSRLSKN